VYCIPLLQCKWPYGPFVKYNLSCLVVVHHTLTR